MFLLFTTMLSGVLGQQTWSLLPLSFQNQQLRNASPFTLHTQKASVSAQPQMRNRLRTLRGNLLLVVHGSQQQKQILTNMSIIQKSTSTSSESISHVLGRCPMEMEKRVPYGPDIEVTTGKSDSSHNLLRGYIKEKRKKANNEQILPRKNDMRHRDLPITSTVYQKTLNEAGKMDTFEHMSFQNKSQSDERSAERGTRLSVRQRQEQLQKLHQLANLKLEFVQTKVPIPTISNEQSQNTSRSNYPSLSRQRTLVLEQSSQAQWPKTSQLPMLTIAMFEPQKSPNNRIVSRASQTTRQSAQASLTRKGQPPMDTHDNTNDVFLECCKKKNVNAKCESRCNFDILNRRVLTAMFIGSDPCPGSNGRKLLSCAAQDSDHTNCCRANGVQRTTAGDKCLLFCQMSLESNFQADISMMPCWGVLHEIKQCFRLALIQKQHH